MPPPSPPLHAHLGRSPLFSLRFSNLPFHRRSAPLLIKATRENRERGATCDHVRHLLLGEVGILFFSLAPTTRAAASVLCRVQKIVRPVLTVRLEGWWGGWEGG